MDPTNGLWLQTRLYANAVQEYSAFAETHLTLGRIDFEARLRWLFYLLQSRTITGRANSFGHTLTRFFHNDQSLKQTKKLNRLPKIAPSGNSAMELAS
jgi:hypothetical protein